MKNFKKLLNFVVLLGVSVPAFAIPAHPDAHTVKNADGTKVTLQLTGDEFFNYTTTSDGYTVVRNTAGNWVYVTRKGNKLVPTNVVAHDAATRTGEEIALRSAISKRLVDNDKIKEAQLKRADRDKKLVIPSRGTARGIAKAPAKAGGLNNFRGLVILVNFNDRKFHRDDIQDFYARMTNERNYTGYTSDIYFFNSYGAYTGSVRDYFYDNSMGQFDPQFDVFGPIDVDYSCEDGRNKSSTIFLEILNNFYDNYGIDLWQNYDSDGDGCVDLVYFIVAGFGSNYSGNNSNYLWPHATYFVNGNYDPVIRLACSTEFYGWDAEYQYMPDGIGVICHEFSHCLGVEDLYDTNYGTDGQARHPGRWEIMASGGYLNYSRTPAGYGIYDRYAMGFANPPVISRTGRYSLNPVGDSNEGFIIETPVANEKFLLENRQKSSKWDEYVPGHGMLVYRMDSTDASAWRNNRVNCDTTHLYYELLRAGQDMNAMANSDSDPFPGSGGVTLISKDAATTPNLMTWSKRINTYSIKDIAEQNNVVSFTLDGKSRKYPIKICGTQLCDTLNMEAFLNGLRSDGYLTKGSISYEPSSNTLTLNGVEFSTSALDNAISYSPAYSDMLSLSDTLHIVVVGENALSCSYSRGSTTVDLTNVHAMLEGEGTLALFGGGRLGTAISLNNSALELNGRASLIARGAYAINNVSNTGSVIAKDNDLVNPATIRLFGTTSTTSNLAQLDLRDGYYIASPTGATLTNGSIVNSSGANVRFDWVEIQQSRTPIAILGTPVCGAWTSADWSALLNELMDSGYIEQASGIAYDSDTHTLLLDGLNLHFNGSQQTSDIISNGYYSSSHDCYIEGYKDFSIMVNGSNSIESSASNVAPFSSYGGNTTIKGAGSLNFEHIGNSPAVALSNGSTLRLSGPDVSVVSATGACGIKGNGNCALRVNAGMLSVTTPEGVPFEMMNSVTFADSLMVLQPQNGTIAVGPNNYMIVYNSDSSIFGNGTLLIGMPQPSVYGDVNGDGEVTVGDVSAIYNIILGLSEEFREAADINGDGEVTVGDVSAIYDIILGS